MMNGSDILELAGKQVNDSAGPVPAAVVHEDDLSGDQPPAHRLVDPVDEDRDVLFHVEAGHDDAQRGARGSPGPDSLAGSGFPVHTSSGGKGMHTLPQVLDPAPGVTYHPPGTRLVRRRRRWNTFSPASPRSSRPSSTLPTRTAPSDSTWTSSGCDFSVASRATASFCGSDRAFFSSSTRSLRREGASRRTGPPAQAISASWSLLTTTSPGRLTSIRAGSRSSGRSSGREDFRSTSTIRTETSSRSPTPTSGPHEGIAAGRAGVPAGTAAGFSRFAGGMQDFRWKEGNGIYRNALPAHLKMEVGSAGVAGPSHTRDRKTLLHCIPRLHQQLAGVSVEGGKPAAVIDDDHLAVAPFGSRPDHPSWSRRPNLLSPNAVDVDAVMARSVSFRAEGRRDLPHQGPVKHGAPARGNLEEARSSRDEDGRPRRDGGGVDDPVRLLQPLHRHAVRSGERRQGLA